MKASTVRQRSAPGRRSVAGRRRGAALLEFALVAPIMLFLFLAVIQFGRVVMAMDLLANIARQGARVGAVAGRSNTDITTAVDNALSNSTIPSRSNGTTLTIAVNGNTAVNASTAVTDDQIAVQVSVPVGNVAWLSGNWFISSTTPLVGTVVMRRE